MSSLEFKHYALGPSLAQCCGGTVTVLLEPFIGKKEKLYLFGAGHVGKEVVKVLESLPVKIYWIDEREEEFPETIHKNVQKIISQDPVSEIKADEEGGYILIMTHTISHKLSNLIFNRNRILVLLSILKVLHIFCKERIFIRRFCISVSFKLLIIAIIVSCIFII